MAVDGEMRRDSMRANTTANHRIGAGGAIVGCWFGPVSVSSGVRDNKMVSFNRGSSECESTKTKESLSPCNQSKINSEFNRSEVIK